MAIDNEILEDFTTESKTLLDQLIELLQDADGDPSLVSNLDKYGQIVDRMMGGAKSLAQAFPEEFPPGHLLHQFGDYAAVCKSVGYKASQIHDNEPFYNVCVAFLLDATEMLQKMLKMLNADSSLNVSQLLTKTFLERLSWINAQFKGDVRATVASKETGSSPQATQTEIDDLLKKLGVV